MTYTLSETSSNLTGETTESKAFGITINYQRLKYLLTQQDSSLLENTWDALGGFSQSDEVASFLKKHLYRFNTIDQNNLFTSKEKYGNAILINPDILKHYRNEFEYELLKALDINFETIENLQGISEKIDSIPTKTDRKLLNMIYKPFVFVVQLVKEIYQSAKKSSNNLEFESRTNNYNKLRKERYGYSSLFEVFLLPFISVLNEIKSDFEKDKSDKNKLLLLGKGLKAIENNVKLNIAIIWVHEYVHGQDTMIKGPSDLSQTLTRMCDKLILIGSIGVNLTIVNAILLASFFENSSKINSIQKYFSTLEINYLNSGIALPIIISSLAFVFGGIKLKNNLVSNHHYIIEKYAIHYEKKVFDAKIKLNDSIKIDRDEFWNLDDDSERNKMFRNALELIS